MRLWHYTLIPALPRQQVLGQWRECCLIAKNIREKGTPNHILVNPIMDYPIDHFIWYSYLVFEEMLRRGYNADFEKIRRYFSKEFCIAIADLFPNWHTQKYMTQCLANLEEKHDRGGITDKEWDDIKLFVAYQRYGKE